MLDRSHDLNGYSENHTVQSDMTDTPQREDDLLMCE